MQLLLLLPLLVDTADRRLPPVAVVVVAANDAVADSGHDYCLFIKEAVGVVVAAVVFTAADPLLVPVLFLCV